MVTQEDGWWPRWHGTKPVSATCRSITGGKYSHKQMRIFIAMTYNPWCLPIPMTYITWQTQPILLTATGILSFHCSVLTYNSQDKISSINKNTNGKMCTDITPQAKHPLTLHHATGQNVNEWMSTVFSFINNYGLSTSLITNQSWCV